MRKCPFCAEEIQPDAIKCKHCNTMLDGSGAASKVAVSGLDPFAQYHTEIQGKKKGRITVVGYLGILVGILFVFGAFISLQNPADDGMGAVFTGLIGVGFATASFLWARR